MRLTWHADAYDQHCIWNPSPELWFRRVLAGHTATLTECVKHSSHGKTVRLEQQSKLELLVRLTQK
eukprot:5430317-Pleurochrysis_carterae.AAC.5